MKDLRSGIEYLKQAKAYMSKANGIMSDYISKLKELEEENAELKAELDDWKGNAEGFQPDEYMKLPLDADGVPIRIGDEMVGICTEKPFVVDGYRRFPAWEKLGFTAKNKPGIYEPSAYQHKKPEPPDSWEKLEEDMMKRSSCNYFGFGSSMESCNDCPHGERLSGTSCFENARRDMLARAKKLAGIEEA